MVSEIMESAARAKSARITERLRAAGIEHGAKWTAPLLRLKAARARLDRFAAFLRFDPQSPDGASLYARS